MGYIAMFLLGIVIVIGVIVYLKWKKPPTTPDLISLAHPHFL